MCRAAGKSTGSSCVDRLISTVCYQPSCRPPAPPPTAEVCTPSFQATRSFSKSMNPRAPARHSAAQPLTRNRSGQRRRLVFRASEPMKAWDLHCVPAPWPDSRCLSATLCRNMRAIFLRFPQLRDCTLEQQPY